METQDNTCNLKSLDNIRNIFKEKYNIILDSNYPYYDKLMIYDKLRRFLLFSPDIINKRDIAHIKDIIKNLKYEKNINCVSHIKLNAINDIKILFMQLKEAIYTNPDTEVGKYSRFDIERVKNESYILPIVLLKSLQYCKAKPVADNSYVTYCPFHDGKKLSFSITEDEARFHCFNKDCAKSGNVINYLEDTTTLGFLSIIETLALAYDICLPDHGQTYEDDNLVKDIKAMLKNELYLSLVNESFKKTIGKHPEMTKEDIIRTYRFKHIDY
jgi:hypothetical protein